VGFSGRDPDHDDHLGPRRTGQRQRGRRARQPPAIDNQTVVDNETVTDNHNHNHAERDDRDRGPARDDGATAGYGAADHPNLDSASPPSLVERQLAQLAPRPQSPVNVWGRATGGSLRKVCRDRCGPATSLMGKQRDKARVAEHDDAGDARLGDGKHCDTEGLAPVIGRRGGLTVSARRDHSPVTG
jgi:hypothetical protein